RRRPGSPSGRYGSLRWPARRGRWGSWRNQLLDMLGEDVDLEVDAIADRELTERGVIARVRDDGNGEPITIDRVDGQAHPGGCDRALLHDIAQEPRRGVDLEHEVRAEIGAQGELAGAVDVAGDPVPPEAISDPERALEVDAPPDPERAERGPRQRLAARE